MDEKDKTTNKLREMQNDIRKNALDTQSYLTELDQWQRDIREKDAALLMKSSTDTGTVKEVHPIRSGPTGSMKPGKKTCKKKTPAKPVSIKSSDYQSWDKFDAGRACDDFDLAGVSEDDERCGSECECDKTDEEIERQARAKRAEFEKTKGNEFFAKDQFKEAIEAYSLALSFNDSNPVYFANRAMALLKLKRFTEAEADCTKAISLDPFYVKAYHRRATARLSLKNLHDAKEDFTKVVNFQPTNKEAQEKLAIIQEWEQKHRRPVEARLSDPLPVIPRVQTPVALKSTIKTHEKPVEYNASGQIRVYPLPQPDASDDSKPLRKPLRKVEIREAEAPLASDLSLDTNLSDAVPHSDIPDKSREMAPDVAVQPISAVSNVPATTVGGDGDHSSGKPSGPAASSPVDLSLPESPRAFMTACAYLSSKQNVQEYGEYIQKIPPGAYRGLIGQNLSSDIMSIVIGGALWLADRGDLRDAWPHLSALTGLPRFSFFVHTLTQPQKSELKRFFVKLGTFPEGHISRDAVLSAAARFSVTLE